MLKAIIGSIVGIVIIAGGYFAATSNKNKVNVSDVRTEVTSTTSTTSTTSQTVATTAAGEAKKTFTELMNSAGSFKCTVTTNANNITTDGIAYLNNGMMKGEFSTKAQGMNIDSNFIIRDGFSYMWSSLMPTGYKIKILAQGATASAGTAAKYTFDTSKISKYDCQPWMVDQSKFTLPATITFTEMSNK